MMAMSMMGMGVIQSVKFRMGGYALEGILLIKTRVLSMLNFKLKLSI